MPTISIIILTYNREALLMEALNSIFEQGFTDYEIIIIDDGSTDNTQQQLLKLKDNPIRYYYTEHLGNLSQLRNLGWEHAKGEFIAFLDADDIWLPGKLEAQWQIMKTNPGLALVFTDVAEFNQEGNIRSSIYQQLADRKTIDQFELTLSGRMPIYASSVLLRKRLAEEIGGFENALILGDTHFFLRLIKAYPSTVLFESLVRIRKHHHNISVYKEREAYVEMLAVLQFFRQNEDISSKLFRKYKSYYLRLLADFDQLQGHIISAAKGYLFAAMEKLLMHLKL